MAKLVFSSKRQIDEWNPHIVRYIRDKAPEIHGTYYHLLKKMGDVPEDIKGKIRATLGNDKSDVLEANFETWIAKWNSAQIILNKAKKLGIYPLAYRLEPTVSEPVDIDPIEGSKFGGVPDFRQNYSFRFSKEKGHLEIISRLWPSCGGCGEYMRFLAGVDLSDWLLPIHYMTANSPDRKLHGLKINDPNIHYFQYSGLGLGKNLCADSWPLFKPFFQIFYCNKPHFDSPAFDSMLYIEHRNSECDEKLLDIEAYRKTISRFVKDNNIKSNIPIQTLEGLALRFDIDLQEGELIKKWMENAIEKHPEVFGNESPYQFFGRPYSQHEQKRYGCQNTSLGLHRMAPIVNWTDLDHDFSYQIYGCLICQYPERRQIHCKTDRSCT